MATIQRRGRRIMMTGAARDTYLAEQRTCRVATVSAAWPPPHRRPLVHLGRHLSLAVLDHPQSALVPAA